MLTSPAYIWGARQTKSWSPAKHKLLKSTLQVNLSVHFRADLSPQILGFCGKVHLSSCPQVLCSFRFPRCLKFGIKNLSEHLESGFIIIFNYSVLLCDICLKLETICNDFLLFWFVSFCSYLQQHHLLSLSNSRPGPPFANKYSIECPQRNAIW